MNEYIPFEPIVVPQDWNAVRDIEEYESRFGPSDDYFGELFERITNNHSELEELIDQCLEYFGEAEDCILLLSLPVKLHLLKKHLSSSTRELRYAERTLALVNLGLKVLREYEALMTRYAKDKSEDSWLYPLCDLADWLATAEFKLREGMECEYDDFLPE